MTLDEAIKHAGEVMVENLEKTKGRNASDPIAICRIVRAEECRQLAEWLKELKRLREQTEHEKCNDCISRGDALKTINSVVIKFDILLTKQQEEIAISTIGLMKKAIENAFMELPSVKPRCGDCIIEHERRLREDVDKIRDMLSEFSDRKMEE